MAKTKTKVLVWLIKLSVGFIKGTRREVISFSNLFNNNIKRTVRNNLDYKTSYYIEDWK